MWTISQPDRTALALQEALDEIAAWINNPNEWQEFLNDDEQDHPQDSLLFYVIRCTICNQEEIYVDSEDSMINKYFYTTITILDKNDALKSYRHKQCEENHKIPILKDKNINTVYIID